MRRLFAVLFLGLSLFLLNSSAFAQDFSRKFTLGLNGGFWKLGLTEHSDTNTVGNFGTLSFRYNLREKLSLGISISYANTWEADLSKKEGGGAGFTFSRKDDATRSTQIWLDPSLIYYFRPWEKLNPYVFGGVGIAFWNVKNKEGEVVQVLDRSQNPFDLRDQELTFSWGGGVEYRITERWGVDFGARFRVFSRLFTSFKDTKDIVGSEPGWLDLPKGSMEVFLGGCYYLGRLMDSDKDGVPDRVDFCADTPFGAMVNERGCPLDSDGDGIYDGLDKCPDTPPGSKVDVNGCRL